jgi:hypothetical protein
MMLDAKSCPLLEHLQQQYQPQQPMRLNCFPVAVLASLAVTVCGHAQVTLSTLNSFGGGDGWLSPGEGGYAYLGTGSTERGLAFGRGLILERSTMPASAEALLRLTISRWALTA